MIEVETMSNEKSQSPQYQQQAAFREQADAVEASHMLDEQYKPLGIPAVNAAMAQMHSKIKKSGEQMG